MKRMSHPNHGYHHAYSPQEEAVMRGNGWGDDVPAEPVVSEPVEPAEEMTAEPVAEAPRRGRPRKN